MTTVPSSKFHTECPLANHLYHGDCVEWMRRWPDQLFDMVFADPPYNINKNPKGLVRPDQSKVKAKSMTWDQFDDWMAYDGFTQGWLVEARRLLKPNGSLWVSGTYHNIFRVGKILQDLGFWIINDIVWRKTNPMPHFYGRRFTNAHEILIWAAKSKDSAYYFNYQAMKAMNHQQQMRSDWTLPICLGRERAKNQDGASIHPTQKPESLLYRVLLASTVMGDKVLDPFAGTGTTGVLCKRMGREYVLIERDDQYIPVIHQRLRQTKKSKPVPVIPDSTSDCLSVPEITLSDLVAYGFLTPGQMLVKSNLMQRAWVGEDGRLITETGQSIVLKDSADLWGHWLYRTRKGLRPLSDLLNEHGAGS